MIFALPVRLAGVQTSFESILGSTVREQVIFLGGGHSFGGATQHEEYILTLLNVLVPLAGVQTSFESILGLTVREQVIFLGGGHSFGGATLDGSGWNGSFTGGDNWPKVRPACTA
jgi:hypothetical protein